MQDPTRTARVTLLLVLLFFGGISCYVLWHVSQYSTQAAVITINWAAREQTIDGFGGSCADFRQALTPQLADFFFTTNGLGFTLLRTQIIPNTSACNQVFGSGLCVPTDEATILSGELAVARQAVSRGATVFSSPWSPPAAYKDNGVYGRGGKMIGNAANYTNYAKILASYVTLMRRNNIPLYAISVQNEPDISQTYPSALWTTQQIHDFVPYLSAALSTAGFGATRIIVAEQSNWSFSYTDAIMADKTTAAQVGILASHGYGQSNPRLPLTFRNYGGQRLWQTEVSSSSNVYNGSMSDALRWAQTLHSYLADAHVNAWIWWFLTDMPKQGDGTDNAALTDINGKIPLRAYVTGNWSKFVRPGWHEVTVNNPTSLPVTAFQSPSGNESAIVVVNASWFSRVQSIYVGSGLKLATPWVTSAALPLVPQHPVTVSAGLLTYSIPAKSVVTFVASGPVSQ